MTSAHAHLIKEEKGIAIRLSIHQHADTIDQYISITADISPYMAETLANELQDAIKESRRNQS